MGDYTARSSLPPPLEEAGNAILSAADSEQLARQIALNSGTAYELKNLGTALRDASEDNFDSCSNDTAEDIARDLAAVRNIDAVPTLLDVLCESTGMGFAMVARVTPFRWKACAVRDDIDFGLHIGGELVVNSTFWTQSQTAGAPLIIEHASSDPLYCQPQAPASLRIESCVSVPIVMPNGCYFGNLCAMDFAPARIAPCIVSMFTRFARLIGQQIEAELARMQQAITLHDERAAGDLREQFIAILGHDLRNPLHAILATSDLLGRRLEEAALLAMTARIKTNATRMSSMIDDVLDFARGRLGSGIDADMRRVDDIAQDLTAVIRELQDANPDRGISVDIQVAGPVYCDRVRLQQMASNLVANALSHGSAESLVRVTASADQDYLVFSVWNDGEPIPPSSMGKIFGPFWRHTVSSSAQGLGLGLYICSQIVRAHNGVLSVTSTRANGTYFSARLPVRRTPLWSSSNGLNPISNG